jgi:uncharacterized protein HemX
MWGGSQTADPIWEDGMSVVQPRALAPQSKRVGWLIGEILLGIALVKAATKALVATEVLSGATSLMDSADFSLFFL